MFKILLPLKRFRPTLLASCKRMPFWAYIFFMFMLTISPLLLKRNSFYQKGFTPRFMGVRCIEFIGFGKGTVGCLHLRSFLAKGLVSEPLA
jgi:hypothetical protein